MPLTKSFSEQNRGAKPQQRSQWQRSKSNPGPRADHPQPPPLPVSTKTKAKLQAFQFAAAPDTNTHDESTPKHAPAPAPAPPPGRANPTVQVTPAADRTAWQDLLAPRPDAPQDDDNFSPGERVLWRNDQEPGRPVARSPLLPRKNRKRARSSSPCSSSPAVDGTGCKKKGLARVLKTPRADPALDLWDRLSVPGMNASPSGLTNPLLAQLMVSSSPHPRDGTGLLGNARPLRKTVSCGSHWPKRRKFERMDSDLAEVPAAAATAAAAARSQPAGAAAATADSKLSMVSALLETVNGEIRKSGRDKSSPAGAPQQTSSSVTSPNLGPQSHSRQQHGSSPLAKKSAGAMGREPLNSNPAGATKSSSSDYGDDDFDDETLMELDASILVSGDDSTMVASVPNAAPVQQAPVVSQKDSDGEFGDFDDDFLDGAEALVAEVEAKHATQTQAQAQAQADLQKQKQQAQQAQQAQKPWAANDNTFDDEFDDDFGDDFDGADFDAIEKSATQAAAQPPSFPINPSQKPKAIQRYLITSVVDTVYADERGREFPEKILFVQAERTNAVKSVHLRGDWLETQASPKAYVHIIGVFEPSGRCVVDNNHNILILHPDQLVSSTVVADSFTCMRRAVLQDRVKATSEATPPLVYGTILHEVFQEALMANNWDLGFLGSVVSKILRNHLEDLYIIKVTMEDAHAHVMSKMPELRSWAQAFVAASPKPNAVVQGKNGERVNMCVSKLLDVEEHVWSPMYGLKGNIDATVQVTMRDLAKGSSSSTRTLTVPFEVKTGKNATANHQAQTVLYNLLLSDRYDIEIAYGVLYYMETSQTLRIPAIRHELRHMIMQRNMLACYIRERSVQLPPMKRSKNACGRCYAQASCFTYHKLADGGDGETSGLHETFDEAVRHLTPTHREFFLKWEDLLTKEEKESQKLRRELWTMVSTEREKLGRCFSNVVIEEGSAVEDKQTAKINRFSYNFVKDTTVAGSSASASGFSFLDSQLAVGEPIVVSDEQGHFALALGYVTAVRKQRISVAVDRRLHNARIRQAGFDEVDNQVFASIMEVAPEGAKTQPSQTGKIKPAPIRYRLDKDEFSNGMATVRNNLVQAMADGPFGSAEIRRLVVDLVAPRFKATPTQYTIPEKDSLNVDQKAAVEKCGTEALRTAELFVPNLGGLRSRHFDDAASFAEYGQLGLNTLSSTTSPSKRPHTPPTTFCPGPNPNFYSTSNTGPTPGSTPSTCWLADLVHPSAHVRFVNTDALLPHAREQAKGNRIVNPCEARVVAQLVDALLAVGVPAGEIGVVTHYRSQLALLRHVMRGVGTSAYSSAVPGTSGMGGAGGMGSAAHDIEMHTADRFQGRDKSVVILSLVRSNEACAIGELLKDWRRINVAFTRAKTKLLVVGSRSTLGGCGEGEMLAQFVGLMEGREWVYELPEGALEGHVMGGWGGGIPPAVVTIQGGDAMLGEQGMPTVKGNPNKGFKSTRKKGLLSLTSGTGSGSGSGGGGVRNREHNKENRPPLSQGRTVEPKKTARIGERAMLKGKPVLRDILNDLMDGGY
ncbi:DNA replication factor Dna2-domain-containing protein [Chaetomium sp. MPI-SDFR-AT-0129]|nr:DNA replication factor Dna2-domain-containing protein [Chaetomium sp. MPI-SDFR-AT-0129]